ncbi:MAG TPA: ribosome biogenesis factor YjgA [Wenzhouxiangellaceae bacterium]|nr:ribosome biogenesis factor YjgA [Wenzhouxiangellaceae bacterium]
MARKSLMRRGRGAHVAETDDDAVDTGPSKTALKAEDHALQDLGVALSELPSGRLAALDMPDDLRQAIRDYRSIRAHGAKKRQRKFLGRLLRNIDTEPFEKVIEEFRTGNRAEARALHRVERWRDELVADDEAVTRWMAEHPGTDAQHFRSLVRAARKHDAETGVSERHGRAYRELFKFIREQMAE